MTPSLFGSRTWDRRWMTLAQTVATWSKDRSRQIGCVVVNSRNVVVSLGWNGFPRGVDDNVEERHARPAKYLWTEHAERNAIYNAASEGHNLSGTTMYATMFTCAECARAIIQSGIQELVCPEPDWNDQTYKADWEMVLDMLSEGGVLVRFLEGATSPVRKEAV